MRHTEGMENESLTSAKPHAAHDNAPLFVSLYIVLLAFFIMLNTIATQDQKKVRQASESVAQAFSYKEVENQPELFEEAGMDLSAAQFFNEMGTLASSFVPVEKLKIYTSGTTMEMVMPQDFIFVPEKAELHQVNIPFFQKIAAALKQWQEGLRIEAEILVSQPRGSVQLIAREENNSLPVERASALAHYLEENKVNGKSILPGLKYEEDGNVTLRFHVREIEGSRLNLTDPAQKEKLP